MDFTDLCWWEILAIIVAIAMGVFGTYVKGLMIKEENELIDDDGSEV